MRECGPLRVAGCDRVYPVGGLWVVFAVGGPKAGPVAVRFAVVNHTRAGPQTVARKEPKDSLF